MPEAWLGFWGSRGTRSAPQGSSSECTLGFRHPLSASSVTASSSLPPSKNTLKIQFGAACLCILFVMVVSTSYNSSTSIMAETRVNEYKLCSRHNHLPKLQVNCWCFLVMPKSIILFSFIGRRTFINTNNSLYFRLSNTWFWRFFSYFHIFRSHRKIMTFKHGLNYKSSHKYKSSIKYLSFWFVECSFHSIWHLNHFADKYSNQSQEQ